MADNVIQIKRSSNTASPSDGSLQWGELAYSFSSNTMWIGTSSNTSIEIGGGEYVGYLDHTHGVLTANSAVIVDTNKNIDYLSVENLRIQSSGDSLSYITRIVEEITDAVTNAQLPTARAVKVYVEDVWSANVDITGGSITGVELNTLDTPLDVADGGTGTRTITENGIAYAANTSIFDFVTGSNGEILQITDSGPNFGGIDGGTY